MAEINRGPMQEAVFSACKAAMTSPGQQAVIRTTLGSADYLYKMFSGLRRVYAEESIYYDEDFIEPEYRGWGYLATLVAKVLVKADPAIQKMAPEWSESRELKLVHQLEPDGEEATWLDTEMHRGKNSFTPDAAAEAKFIVFDTGQIILTPSIIPYRACVTQVDTEYEDCTYLRYHIANAQNRARYAETRETLKRARCFTDKRRNNLVSVVCSDKLKISMEALDTHL